MKAIRRGHNYQATGAVGLVSEVHEADKIKSYVVHYLQLAGEQIKDVSPGNMDRSSDLAYGVKLANNLNANYFGSIHLNSFDRSAYGVEVLYYPGSAEGKIMAERIASKISSLGFYNRGAKADTRGLYELRKTSMVANIIECFFCDSAKDVETYNRVGSEAIGKAIAEGILGRDINGATSKPVAPPKPQPTNNWVATLQEECNRQGFSNQKVDGIPGPKTLAGCPTVREGARGNITRLLQEKLGVAADGIFGANTKKAVIAFQRERGLSADGIVGQNTWKKLLGL